MNGLSVSRQINYSPRLGQSPVNEVCEEVETFQCVSFPSSLPPSRSLTSFPFSSFQTFHIVSLQTSFNRSFFPSSSLFFILLLLHFSIQYFFGFIFLCIIYIFVSFCILSPFSLYILSRIFSSIPSWAIPQSKTQTKLQEQDTINTYFNRKFPVSALQIVP